MIKQSHDFWSFFPRSYHDRRGSAIPDQDFRVDTISFTVPANQINSTVDITIIDDLAVESAEYFLVFLDSVSGGISIDHSRSTVTVTIEDDDSIEGDDNLFQYFRLN